ncbi:MAG TPA: XRE family transcriptional regulator [Candidatus Dormibacteraeota bacterium]|nr:XRE family transcriptional regulator [Candidatus Dormibacteraeota bacterium]
MKRIEAKPTPAVLVWARRTAGMSLELAARKAAIKLDQLSAWEAGASRPSIPQLRKLAAVYRRPLAAFYLSEAPVRFQVMHDFRRLSNVDASYENSPKLAYEVRRAFDRREWALELLQGLDESPPPFTARARLGENVEQVATRLRSAIAVTVERQADWRFDTVAFKNWRSLVEQAGILTLQATGIQLDEARGFSISMNPLPVVVVNIKDAPRGRIFTLLHEVAHIMLSVGGICDLHDSDEEAFCNQVAGAVLFPKEALLSSNTVRQHRKGDPAWTDYELRELSRQFGGSREAALVRLLELRLTTQAFYNQMKNEFLRIYKELQEKRQQTEGFAPPHVLAISSAGPLFTSLVVENFNKDRITASDVSDYLQIRLKHLKDLQGEFSREA